MRPLVALSLIAGPALAEAPPRIVVDVAPLQALVAAVAGDLAEPALLLPPGASPHHFAFRPSDARALSEADLVFWVGPALTPELAQPLATLAPGATRVEMLATSGWERRPRREGPLFAADAPDDSTLDPHAWMDPAVGRAWIATIAAALAEADPENAERYRRNAAAAAADLTALEAEIAARLAPVAGQPFLLAHDALQYFDARFGLTAVGALLPPDGASVGPARAAALREAVATEAISCLLTDPETDPRWIALIAEGRENPHRFGRPRRPRPGARSGPLSRASAADGRGACRVPRGALTQTGAARRRPRSMSSTLARP